VSPTVDDEEDVEVFRHAVRDVKRLDHEAPVTERPRPRPSARFARADRLAVLKESLTTDVVDPSVASGEELVFHRPGIQDAVVRKLRRGHYRVQAEIDLHGFTVAEAKQELRIFVADAVERDLRCVRIIHGKGLRSGHRGPVLKGAVSGVLRRMGVVLAYVSARQVDGGTGAVYVLLSPQAA
jgi:DNA-nicking Smr family endonuclease